MKLFDPYKALEKIIEQHSAPASSASFASNAPHQGQKEAEKAKEAAPRRESPKNEGTKSQQQPNDMRHGFAVNGHPKTWTGNIVSLHAWRRLSEWERHGPDGRVWDGIAKHWRSPK